MGGIQLDGKRFEAVCCYGVERGARFRGVLLVGGVLSRRKLALLLDLIDLL